MAPAAHAQYYNCVEGDYFMVGGILFQTDDVCSLSYPSPYGGWYTQCDLTGYQFYNYMEQANGGFYDPDVFAVAFGCFPYFRSDHPHHKYTTAFAEALTLPKVE
jgi:hypothetical protein